MSRHKADTWDEKLITACSQRNLELASECLKNGANMNKICSNGRTALGVAAELGNVQILQLFLQNLESETALASASSSSNLGYFVVVHSDSNEALSERANDEYSGVDFDEFNDSLIQRIPGLVDRVDNTVGTPDGMDNLEWDAEINEDDEEFLELEKDPWAMLYLWYAKILSQTGALLMHQPPPDTVDGGDEFGLTALHYAASEGHNQAIQILIQSGSKVNAEDSDSFTPLHLAAAKDRVEIVELLLAHGANPHHRSSDGISPLHVSASRGLLDNARALVAAGANVNAVDLSDRTPLHLAVSRRRPQVVSYLIENGAKVNLEEIHGYTPLSEAVCSKDVAIMELLLNAGAKVTHSHHLLHFAVLHRHEAMVRVLLQAGTIVNLRNESGETPLLLALQAQNISIIRLLLSHGASLNCVSSVTGQTALEAAIQHIKRDCRQFLEIFSLFEEFGWELSREKGCLSKAVSAENNHAVVTLVSRCDLVSDETLPDRSKMLNLLLLRDNRFLVELFVHAGFSLRNFRMYDGKAVENHWFRPLLCNPLPLQSLARIRIRSALRDAIFRKLDLLPLPNVLKAFLRLEDFPCSCQTSVR